MMADAVDTLSMLLKRIGKRVADASSKESIISKHC